MHITRKAISLTVYLRPAKILKPQNINCFAAYSAVKAALAEKVGFEPTVRCRTTDFESVPL